MKPIIMICGLFGLIFSTHVSANSIGTYAIDRDGDGYGVGVRSSGDYSSAGPNDWGDRPDANDLDPTINTTQSAVAKFGSFQNIANFKNYVRSLGYRHSLGNVYFISLNGSDQTGAANDVSRPFRTMKAIVNRYQAGTVGPGDVIVYRGGTTQSWIYERASGDPRTAMHTSYFNPKYLSGKIGRPILVMTYPGERVVMNGSDGAIAIAHADNLIVRGFVVTCFDTQLTTCDQKNFGRIGIHVEGTEQVTIEQVEVFRMRWGIWGGVWAPTIRKNLIIADSVVRDNNGEHGIYLPSDFNGVSQFIGIVRNLIFRNRRTGIQFNGLADYVLIQDNKIHSNAVAAISLTNGTTNSVIVNNNIYNNPRGLVMFTDNAPVPSVRKANKNNFIGGNTIWVSKNANGICDSQWAPPCTIHPPAQSPAIDMASWAEGYTHSGNIFWNNVFATFGSPAIRSDNVENLTSSYFFNNLFDRADGSPFDALGCENTDGTHNSFGNLAGRNLYFWSSSKLESTHPASMVNNISANPLFANVSSNYSLNPEFFNFSLRSGSPAIDLGVWLPFTPKVDIFGMSRVGRPDAGAYEFDSRSSSETGEDD